MAWRLQLYGEVAWVHASGIEPVRGTQRLGVLLLLAEQQGSTVSVDVFLDQLWEVPPRSGSNAVQRHISALRAQLKQIGGPVDAEDILSSVPGGYRLSKTIATDLSVLQSALHGPRSQGLPEDVFWWEQPLAGVTSEVHDIFRYRLESVAAQALQRSSDTGRSSIADNVADHARVQQRAALMQTHSTSRAGGLITNIHRKASRSVRAHDVEYLDDTSLQILRRCGGLWAAHRAHEALDIVEEQQHVLPKDLYRRFVRWLIWLDPTSGTHRVSFTLLAEEGVAQPHQFERTVVSLDACAFEAMPNGRELAAGEAASAEGRQQTSRALRVQFLLSMSAPHQDKNDTIIDQLDQIDLADAVVEATRFRALTELRLGRLGEVRRRLEQYEATVAQLWPAAGDDFAPMATAALQRSIAPEASAVFGSGTPALGFVADRWVLPIADTLSHLLSVNPETSEPQFHLAVSALSPSAASALGLLSDLRAHWPVTEQAVALADSLPEIQREKQFHLLLVALVLVAEELKNDRIAHAVTDALQPWRGQTLGLWPVDYYFGSADQWLDRLAAI